MAVTIERPRFEYSPAHAYALVDMANAGKLLLPPKLFSQVASERRGARGPVAGDKKGVPPLAWWDSGRCMVHGKFDATLLGGEGGRFSFEALGSMFGECTPPQNTNHLIN